MKLLPSRKRPPRPEAASIKAGDAARDRKDWPEAVLAYRTSLGINPSLAAIWVQLGHALKESADLEGAGEAYRKALSLEPSSADTHLQMGHLRKLQGNVSGAADSYFRAAELDPLLRHAVDEIRRLSQQGTTLDQDRLNRLLSGEEPRENPYLSLPQPALDLPTQLREALASLAAGAEANEHSRALLAQIQAGIEAAETLKRDNSACSADARTHLTFDISDLVGYFNNARLPTGIQRVQIEVISGLLRQPQPGMVVEVCTFSAARNDWTAVPSQLFLGLSDMSLESGDITDPIWKATVEKLRLSADLGRAPTFVKGGFLINLGTSWWLRNYFLQVRRIKSMYGVHYVPFVHDMIPIMTPEHCVKPLTQDFISWALGVFSHADFFFTNSNASRRDLISVARTLGYEISERNIHVVELNADFRKPESAVTIEASLARYGLQSGGYALFVSTIESRKNHLNTFKAWEALIEKHGSASMPKLVCVGNRGWLNDAVFEKLESSPLLRTKVLMISGVSDPDLANLYKACAFTVYPSSYEGWGLPVTESLCYGRPVVLSDASSLPEAGGEFGVYFKLGNQADFTSKLERMIFDLTYRRKVSDFIAENFRPRPWADLGLEIAEQVRNWFSGDASLLRPSGTPVAERGRYYWLRQTTETAIYKGMVSSEVFRAGDGWSQPDDWGTWTLLKGATLVADVGHPEGPLRLMLGLLGLASGPVNYSITVGGNVVRSGKLEASEQRWLSVLVPRTDIANGLLTIGIKGDAKEDFSVTTGGIDTRIVSVGVVGFMVCEDADLASRMEFLEALALQQLPDHADNWAHREAVRLDVAAPPVNGI